MGDLRQMLAGNTFINRVSNTFAPTRSSPMHYVHPHWVSSYTRKDGTFVQGFWRDGDGDTSKDRSFGYFARNPGKLF